MLAGWLVLLLVSAYLGALYALARWGDTARADRDTTIRRRTIYVLSSCIYCSSWSYCGSIGAASRGGLDFLPLYLGAILAFALGHPVLARMVRLSKTQRITSVADFVAARYGKSASVAATVTAISMLSSVPYIALQIRALAQSLAIFVDGRVPKVSAMDTTAAVVAAFVTVLLAAFTIAIGTRRLDATEHQRGLMLAIAVEAVVKLAAFIAVGIFVSWGLFGGIGAMTDEVAKHAAIAAVVDKRPDASLWGALIATTMATIFFMPRQFHVSVVENRSESDVRTAGWFVPLYLVALNLFVLPIAVAGLLTFPAGTIDRDFTVLALPMRAGSPLVTVTALIGSVAAATSTVIVATIALSTMVSNDLFMPLLLQRQMRPARGSGKIRSLPILALRRIAILAILGLAFAFAAGVKGAELSSIGLLSLAGMAQIAPAAVGGLVWRRGTARGAIGGSLAGIVVILYTLLLPAVFPHFSAIVTDGPLGFDALRPTDLFGLDLTPFAQGLIWSLSINVLVYCGLSLTRPANANERLQANIFVSAKSVALATSFRLRKSTIGLADLEAGVARYLDPPQVHHLFLEWHAARGRPFDGTSDADASLIIYAESLIASSIGAASSRIVLSLMLQKREMPPATARQIVDDAAFEIQNSRDVLQHAIDVGRDGMAVFDADLRLVAWNRAYHDMFQFPQELMRVGTPLDELVRSNAERGIYGKGHVDDFIAARLEALTRPTEGARLRSANSKRFYDMRSVRLHNGGLFFTYTDATAQAASEEELEAENLTLERRVRERTDELERLNVELVRAKAEAEDANISKSRFLAAASHDLLQPLSAARLYMASLRDRVRTLPGSEDASLLSANVDASLEAVEDILGALLEISHLDAGATKTEVVAFNLGDMLRQLHVEFQPLARERGLRLRVVASSLRVTSDRKLLRRLLQNLISNAIKYTHEGSVLIGARRSADSVRIDVCDTGIGIAESKQMIVFREFERLPAGIEAGPGAGLGLSIVERLARVLDHAVLLRSTVGQGTVFSVTLPRAAAATADADIAMSTGTSQRQRSLDGLFVAAIDNELHILSAITMLLQSWDCVVVNGTNLPDIEADLKKAERAPDVIVADYHIGEVDGLSVIAALRAKYGALPAVLVTADRSPVVRDLALAADVRVLNKPLRPAALRSLLSQWHLVKAAAE